MTPEQLKVLFEGYGPPTEPPKRPNDSQLSALFEPVGDFSVPIKSAKEVKRDTPIQKAKREVMTAVQKARQNMKLLEDADKLAISKIKAPKNQKYKNILHAQEEQLHHYLKQYADNYLPKGITKEYEFPKYFYYTVNGKNGIVHKRTSTDSAMFAKFMNNPEKKAMAEAQGLFSKPIKTKRTSNLPVSPPVKKKPSLDIIPFDGEYLEESMPSHVPTKKNITIQRKSKEPIYDSDDEEFILESLLGEAEQYAKEAKLNAKNASETVKKIKTAMAEDTDAISLLDNFYSAQNAPAPKSKLSTGKDLENAYKAHNQKTFKQFTFNKPAINIGKIDKKI
jgi:hypothetical protein